MGDQLNECWEELSEFIKHKNSIDIGVLNQISSLLAHQNIVPEQSIFTAQISTFLQSISIFSKSKPNLYSQAIALISIDALIYNIYRIARGNDGFKQHSNSFYGWMSTSRLSGDLSEISNLNERQPRKVVILIESVANSEIIFKKVKLILDRSNNKQRNQRYGQNLIETLDYIMTKQKLNKDRFNQLKNTFINSSVTIKHKLNIDYQKVNLVIFSSQLNKINTLLAQGSDQIQFALIRIYYAGKDSMEPKQFEGYVHTAQEMLYNLHRYYIESFQDKNQLFEESKNALFRFLKNEMVQLFIPFFRKFHSVVSKISLKGVDQQNAFLFYKNNESILQNQLLSLINTMPLQLAKLLNSLYLIIQEFYRNQAQSSLTPVKKVLFYSFLLSQSLVDDLLPHLDPSKYTFSYTHILNLFFQNSAKKFTHLSQPQQSLINRLVDVISTRIDDRIKSPQNRFFQELAFEQSIDFDFMIKQPILNHDYELISQILTNLQFTPKDVKNFKMKRQRETVVESPIFKHFKKETSVIRTEPEDDEKIDFMTWMSVGGSQEWSKPQEKYKSKGLKERLSKFQTLKGPKIQELHKLYSEYQQYL